MSDRTRSLQDQITKAPIFDLGFPYTDVGNGERLAHRFGGAIRYSYERQKWLHFNGKIWVWDDGSHIEFLAKETARGILQEAADCQDDDRRLQIAKHALSTEQGRRIELMIHHARSELGIKIAIPELDSNQYLLNCCNGTINLKTGKLQSHNARDYITRMLDIDYEPEAKSKAFDTFLNRIFDNNQELIRYVQKALGYSLTGCQDEQTFYFCHGGGFNGKSTLLGTIKDILGDHATEVDPLAFMVNKFSKTGPDEAIASLYNKRLVISTELASDQQYLSVGLIKRMTGGESLRFERKYEHGWNFQPTHKLWLCGNHEPAIKDTSSSIWLRLKKIPFTIQIPPGERIKGLRQELVKYDSQAILAWLVDGCLDWQTEGLDDPIAVIEAISDYRERQDILHDFIAECCTLQPSERVTVSELYKAYKVWCDDNSQDAIGTRTFNTRMREKGFRTDRGTENKLIWHGIKLIKRGE